jgi:hypothetical protein
VQAIEFLDDYAKGELSEGVPRDPTIGDFLPIYRQHILGLETERGGVENVPLFDTLTSASAHPPTPTVLENLRDALNQAYAYLVSRPSGAQEEQVLKLIDQLDKAVIELALPADPAGVEIAGAPAESTFINNDRIA